MESGTQQPTRRAEPALPAALFGFMRDLREHNDREWFKANKPRYEEAVQEPALAFIAAFAPRLHAISPHFVADARPVGGSLFRIYRDTRFGKDKTPYKTHTGIHFRHAQAKDVHAPGFYLHLEPGSVFVGMGIWRPDSAALGPIRDAIAEHPEAWTAVLAETTRGDRMQLEGSTLKRAPAGYDPEHPLIADLKRKDFIAIARLNEKTVTSPGFPDELAGLFQASAPLMRFVCEAAGVPF
jgi:uncharacterized protein (TIGR02453 family)